MKKIYDGWRQYVQRVQLDESRKVKRSQLQENLETLNEISRDTADKIQRWMRDASVMDYSFNELFDGKMRMAMPFDSEDALKLKKAVRALKKDGWKAGELVPWEGGMHTSNKFPTRKVMQKRQRLAIDGGGAYEQEIEVADLGLSKSYEKEIPAGPRKGEVIQRTDKLGMGKAIAKLVKEKKLDKELSDWWQQKQTYYTKDNNWNEIEGLFSGDEIDYTVIISRHPVDVLRMSDIGSIRSCHSEGSSHFQCAMAEAKGHGPIAYLVPTTMYDMLMGGLYEEERESFSYDRETSESKLLKAAAVLAAEEHIKTHYFPEFRLNTIYKHRMDAERLEGALKTIESDRSVSNAYNELRTEVRALLSDQAILDAVMAKVEGKEWSLADFHELNPAEKEPEKIGDISEFDDKEIFRDRTRGIKGIVAKGRVRFRKFEDEDTGLQFVGVEHRTFGAVPPGFAASMNKWAAESQEEALKEAGYLDEDNHAPNWYSLRRYGGSYEDTDDSTVLGSLFRYFDPDFTSYDGGHNVESVTEEEDDDRYQEAVDRVDELNDYAMNNLEHVSTHAEVNDDMDEPYVYASADFRVELNLLGWNGVMEDYGSKYYQSRGADEDGNPYIIPHSWGSDYQQKRSFERTIEDKLDMYSEETEWDVVVQKGGARGEEGSTTVLEVTFRFSMEDGNTPDDYENFIDYIKDDIDAKYQNIRESIRLALVEDGYMTRNYFDKLNYAAEEEDGTELPTPAEEFAAGLKNFTFYPPSDDGDGEMLFVTRGVGGESYITTPTLMPGQLRKHDRATGWLGTDLQTAFGGERFSLGFGTPPATKHTGLGMHKIAMALSDMQEEAETYAGKQLALDFGETYDAPPDKEVLPDFAKNVEFVTVLATPTASEANGLPNTSDKDARHLGFAIRVKVLSVDSDREIKGAIAFMEYVDNKIGTIAKAFESLWGPAIDEAVETKDKAQAAAVSKGTMEQLTNALDTKVRNMEARDSQSGHVSAPIVYILKAYIEWAHAAWPEMDLLERRTLINQYLRPLQQGSLGSSAGNYEPNSSGSSHAPLHWVRYVKSQHREAGAPEVVWSRYDWVGPDFRKIIERQIDNQYAPQPDADAEQAQDQVHPSEEGVVAAHRRAAAIGTALDQGGGGPAVRRGEPSHLEAYEDEPVNPPEDLRESIRNAIKETIYKEDTINMSSKDKLKEAIRRAISQNLNENWLQRGMAYATGQGEEYDLDQTVASESEAAREQGLRGRPDPDYVPDPPAPYLDRTSQSGRRPNDIFAGSMAEPSYLPAEYEGYEQGDATPYEQDVQSWYQMGGPLEVDQYGYDQTDYEAGTNFMAGYDPRSEYFVDPETEPYLYDTMTSWYEGQPGDRWTDQFGTQRDWAPELAYGDPRRHLETTQPPPQWIDPLGYMQMPWQGRAPAEGESPRITQDIIDSYFGMSNDFAGRVHPVTGRQSTHLAIDAGGRVGDPLYASLPGYAHLQQRYGGAGNTVGMVSLIPDPQDPTQPYYVNQQYMHMNQRSPTTRGQRVEPGQVVGELGNTGTSTTGPHLHWQTRGGSLVDELGDGRRRVGFDMPGTSRPVTNAYFSPAVRDVAPVNAGETATHRRFPNNSFPVPATYRNSLINPTTLNPDIWDYSYYNPLARQGPEPYIPIGPGDPGYGYPQPGEQGYGVVRENENPFFRNANKLRQSKSALRESIKLKVGSNAEAHHGDCEACGTCGNMHGPEEPCELPTLEEAIRQAIFQKLGKTKP